MTTHLLAHDEEQRSPLRPAFSHGPFRLGWAEFWLLSAILAGLLALVGFLVLFYVSAR